MINATTKKNPNMEKKYQKNTTVSGEDRYIATFVFQRRDSRGALRREEPGKRQEGREER